MATAAKEVGASVDQITSAMFNEYERLTAAGKVFQLDEIAQRTLADMSPSEEALWTLAEAGAYLRLRDYVNALRVTGGGDPEVRVERSRVGRGITTRRRPGLGLRYTALSVSYANRSGQQVLLLEFEALDFDALAAIETTKSKGHEYRAGLAARAAREMREAKAARLKDMPKVKLEALDRVWRSAETE